MSKSRLLLSAALAFSCACSSDDDDDAPLDLVDGALASVDAAPGTPETPDAAPGAPDGSSPPGTATLTGTITRSAAPMSGGKGPLFIAIFEASPISGGAGAPVAQALVPDVDMSGNGVSVAYSVEGIPPRDAAYHIIAFLDDNQTVDVEDPAAAGPDKGDLISMNGIMAPTVVIDRAAAVELDLDLNFAMPFDP